METNRNTYMGIQPYTHINKLERNKTMEDRFKFRVFGHSSKKMISISDLSARDFYYGIFVDNRLLEHYFGKGVYTKIQCTGKKDKNNNLIFEGDILKETYFSEDTDSLTSCLYKVEFDKDVSAFCFTELDGGYKNYLCNFDYKPEDYEIIGNIYDNPELLSEME